jgi:hypothetical protein
MEQTGFDALLRRKQSVKGILSNVFHYLNEHYRCEYVFKSAIFNEVLLKHHSLVETGYLTEFRSSNAKADVVILNGTSIVYEIKSDIDRLDRLCSQTIAYQQIFDKVVVVSKPENASKISLLIPSTIGIVTLSPDLQIQTVREPTSNIDNLNRAWLFDCLRKPEYLSIIKTVFGEIPQVPGTRIHSACKQLFVSLSNEQAHFNFVSSLKQRQFPKDQILLVGKASKELKCLLAEKIYSSKECELINFALDQSLIN